MALVNSTSFSGSKGITFFAQNSVSMNVTTIPANANQLNDTGEHFDWKM
jgi:hypothetical protein